MPEGVDEFGQRSQDPGYQIPQSQRQQQSLHPSQPYPDMATAYSTHRVPYPHLGMRHSPGLPPIRDIDPGMSKYGTYANSFVPAPQYGMYPQEVPSGSSYYAGDNYGRRQPNMYENKNMSQTYPSSNRPYPPIKTGDQNYGQQFSDPYSRPYDPHYYQSSAISPAGTMPYSATSEGGDGRNRRRRGNLPKQITDILRAWFQDHLDNPYPSEEQKQMFIQQTGLSMNQVGQAHQGYGIVLIHGIDQQLVYQRSSTSSPSAPTSSRQPQSGIRFATTVTIDIPAAQIALLFQ